MRQKNVLSQFEKSYVTPENENLAIKIYEPELATVDHFDSDICSLYGNGRMYLPPSLNCPPDDTSLGFLGR
ncbi:hypothetical protein STEG23_022997, partial [Scotinomys teguina]